jgi:hypothetical protein
VLRLRRALSIDQISMYQKLRSIHLSIALFSLPFLLAYAISAVEFAHRKWVTHPERTTQESRQLTPGITDARILARQWRGELASVEHLPSWLRFRVVTSLGRTYDVNYSIATGDTVIRTTTVSFLTTLAWLHISNGVWAYVTIATSVGLLILGVTGLYLWFKNHSGRRVGVVLLLAGAGITIGLMISMRLD